MKICFVIPTYNDEASLKKLIDNINKELKNFTLNFVIVDDCSQDDYKTLKNNQKIDLIKLDKNQGSQKAITLGLKYVKDKDLEFDYLIIMDSDGEDKPADLQSLISEAHKKNNNSIIFASRKKRMEIFTFKFFYFFYKLVFKILTGRKINFGNYSCIPKKFLNKIVKVSFLKLHFPAAIIKSKLTYSDIPCDKGPRYAGDSKMSFNNLFVHGFKAFSIFLKEITIRILIFFFISNVILILILQLNLVIKINFILLLFITPLFVYLYKLNK
jgi:glycosyltransferase involved in cell wall biosynthesis